MSRRHRAPSDGCGDGPADPSAGRDLAELERLVESEQEALLALAGYRLRAESGGDATRRFVYMAMDRGLEGVLGLGRGGAVVLDRPDGSRDEVRGDRAVRTRQAVTPKQEPLACGEILDASPGLAAITVLEQNPGFEWTLIRELTGPLPPGLSPRRLVGFLLSLPGPWELRHRGRLVQDGLRLLPDGSVEVRP